MKEGHRKLLKKWRWMVLSYNKKGVRMVKRWIVVGVMLLACLLVVGCGIPQEEHDAVVGERDEAMVKVESLQRGLNATKRDLQENQEELNAIKSELDAVKKELELYKATGIEVYSGVQPPFALRPYGFEKVHLINNRRASNPTWNKLVGFLVKDPTDDDTYFSEFHVCSEFAQDLHNNAEASGIKSAFAVVHFKDTGDVPHALNAFHTTDKGLVFIDCTGEEFSGLVTISFGLHQVTSSESEFKIEWDKVAYLKKGKELGFVSINEDMSLDYNSYQVQIMKWRGFSLEVESYDKAAKAYTDALGFRFFLEEPEYSEFKRWYDELEGRRKELEEKVVNLGPLAWESMGVVSRIEIYW